MPRAIEDPILAYTAAEVLLNNVELCLYIVLIFREKLTKSSGEPHSQTG